MAEKTRKRPRIGDVVEIVTAAGAAYAQYTHSHPRMGALVRVLETSHDALNSDPERLAALPTQVQTFFPLGPACH